jgi:carbonic anhydrase
MYIRTIRSKNDIPNEFRGTPVEKLLCYHNFRNKHDHYEHPEILIGKCMDYRVNLRVPPAFAYKLRTGGCNLGHNDFQVAYIVAVGGVRAIALIGHTDCGMVNLEKKRERFIKGFTEQSDWEPEQAAEFFDCFASENTLCRESDILFEEAARYRQWFPRLPVAVLLFRVEDRLLYLLEE